MYWARSSLFDPIAGLFRRRKRSPVFARQGESNRTQLFAVSGERGEFGTGFDIPQLRGLVAAGCR
jgi:hypothetical protein